MLNILLPGMMYSLLSSRFIFLTNLFLVVSTLVGNLAQRLSPLLKGQFLKHNLLVNLFGAQCT